ncbi:MAG TPA: adenylosuccinate synthetase [Tepidisphaeraceae bacterium]|jgi:adenylosuccinate synthase
MSDSRAILVIDLAFGDCGKGTIIDFLARRTGARTVVRFNGGPQAGHNVVTPDGRHHTFSQFGGATFVPGIRTLLSRFMLIEPYALFNEARHLEQLGVGDATDRLFIDARCLVITPAHQAANRIRELARGGTAHGTCGMGVGETMADAIAHPELALRAEDLANRATVRRRLRTVCELKRQQLAEVLNSDQPSILPHARTILEPTWVDAATENYAALAERATIIDSPAAAAMTREPGTILFEGAQGVLLDERYGFHPHTTWSTTTFANADCLLDEARYEGTRTRIGVLRTYFTRHGIGPLVTEEAALRSVLPEPHNEDAGWQGQFRVGLFDAVAAGYAVEAAGGADWLAVTHVDRLPQLPRRICTAYQVERPGASSGVPALIDRLPVHAAPSLEDRERLAAFCRACRPVYEDVPGKGIDPMLDRIARHTGIPIGITSTGPKAADKRIEAAGL